MYIPFFKIVCIFIISIVYLLHDMIFESFVVSTWSQKFSLFSLFLFFVIGFIDSIVQIILCRSFQMEKAGLAASMNFACVIWGFGADVFIFGIEYQMQELVGVIIILMATFAIVFTTKE